MCCGRRGNTPRNTGKSKLIKKKQHEEMLHAASPEVPLTPRQDLDSSESEEQKQENNPK